MYDPPVTLRGPIINLLTDLKQERDVGAKSSWVSVPMTKILVELEESLKKYPPIKAGTPDPMFRQSSPWCAKTAELPELQTGSR